ncbi:ndufa8, NADH-ubiquinone oxidoreductase complex I 19kd subunit [Cystobasidiomycetes sp. EMM_F5]
MPKGTPHVEELGVTSAPLKSAAFFIGAHCKDFNGLHALQGGECGPRALFEGREEGYALVSKLRTSCLAEFDAHWNCLEKNNQEYYLCRKPERTLNSCVFEKLGLKKEIPGTPEGQLPIHEKKRPIYKAIQK